MPRPSIIFILLAGLGAGAGFLLQQRHDESRKSGGAPAAGASRQGQAEQARFTPLPGMSTAAETTPEGGNSEVGILQSQVAYLEEQVKILQQENSQLIDQLVSLRGGSNVMPPTGAPSPNANACAPPAGPEKESPDFAGIGIELIQVRGLKDIPIPAVVVPAAEVEKHISTWLASQFPEDQGRKQGRALAALGAIPRPVDTIALKASFLTYQIGGWYDPPSQTLYLAQGVDGIAPQKENALALSYAYLFKQYGARLFPPGAKYRTLDSRLGLDSLLAGDAAHLRFVHALQNPNTGGGGGVGEDPDDPSRAVPIPNFLRELELLPFTMGFDFMQAMHSIGGWEQVSATYGRPPISAAEVMDTQVYLQDAPFTLLPISWQNTAVQEQQPFWEDSLGPLGTVLFLKQYTPESVAADTAPGWLNDRLLSYENRNQGRDHIVWQSLWKSSDAADAFFAALRNATLGRYQAGNASTAGPDGSFLLNTANRALRIARTHSGNGVLLVDAATPAFADEALQKLRQR